GVSAGRFWRAPLYTICRGARSPWLVIRGSRAAMPTLVIRVADLTPPQESLTPVGRALYPVPACPDGGIGRRAGFRYLWPKGCGGSSPLLGTIVFRGSRAATPTLATRVAAVFRAHRAATPTLDARVAVIAAHLSYTAGPPCALRHAPAGARSG